MIRGSEQRLRWPKGFPKNMLINCHALHIFSLSFIVFTSLVGFASFHLLHFLCTNQHHVTLVPSFWIREQEITQLRNWQRNVDQLASKFKSLTAPADEVVEDKSQKQDVIQTLSVSLKGTENKTALDALRTTFHRDFKKQLYSDVDDTTFFNRIKKELKHMERRLEDGAVVLQHLEMFLINVACNDPGRSQMGFKMLLYQSLHMRPEICWPRCCNWKLTCPTTAARSVG